MIERRAQRTEIRAPGEGRTFEAIVMRYGVVDDYDTIFDAKCFADSLETRLPRITWAHDWSEPLGRYVDYIDTDESLTLVGEFDDFDAVPRARQAYAQLQSGTIDQFSVGFHRINSTDDDEGRTHFVKAGLDEAALVIVGAVPNTELLSVRSGKMVRTSNGLVVPEDLVVELGKKVAAGELTQAEAKAALDLASGDPVPPPPAPFVDDGTLTAADNALDVIGL